MNNFLQLENRNTEETLRMGRHEEQQKHQRRSAAPIEGVFGEAAGAEEFRVNEQ